MAGLGNLGSLKKSVFAVLSRYYDCLSLGGTAQSEALKIQKLY